jgi:hypothetical protein
MAFQVLIILLLIGCKEKVEKDVPSSMELFSHLSINYPCKNGVQTDQVQKELFLLKQKMESTCPVDDYKLIKSGDSCLKLARKFESLCPGFFSDRYPL